MKSRPDPLACPLEAGGVSFGYEPGQAVLQDFSGQLQPGRVCALIGPNAAGKSTLLRLMLGQLRPWQGQVCLGGCPVGRLTPGQRAGWISYVPQRAGVNFAFTVEQVVAMGRFATTPNPQAVQEALAQCDLQNLGHRIYSHLSVGQQQRVLLARALAQSQGQGRVMLLDEPGSAMDLWHTHQTMGLLRILAKRGMAVLVVVHDLNLAARYADDVWLMDQGRLLAAGSWESVLTPAVLEPVYRVRLNPMIKPGGQRPVFDVDMMPSA